MNPKDRIGAKKLGISHVPSSAIYQMAMALWDGVQKYGKFNWREGPVRASIYLDAADRHMRLWADGQEWAPDSAIHHLGHAMACMAILIDAQAHNALVDDRVKSGVFEPLLEHLNALVAAKSQQADK